MKRPASLLLLLASLLAGAAAAADIKVERAPNVDLSTFRTYAWRPLAEAPDKNIDREIRAAADEALARKGLRRVELGDHPDLWIHYQAGSADTLGTDISATIGWWGGIWLEPGPRVTVRAGLVVLMTDTASEKPVWAGMGVMAGNNPNAFEVMRKRAGKLTRKVLDRYPALD